MLVIGGGIIGLEMACVYDALGVEGLRGRAHRRSSCPAADRDLVQAAREAPAGALRADHARHARSTKVEALPDGITRHLRSRRQDQRRRSTIACWSPSAACRTAARIERRGGRRHRQRARLHSGRQADAHQRAAHLRDRRHRRPADAGAQGDARRQGRGRSRGRAEGFFDARVIPSVAYTDPEVAWVGLTEDEAKAQRHRDHARARSRGRRAVARCRSAATRA